MAGMIITGGLHEEGFAGTVQAFKSGKDRKQILELLLQLQKNHKTTYIFISHDLRVIRSISHNLIVMKDGSILEQGEAKNILNNPQNDYTKNLIKSAFEIV